MYRKFDAILEYRIKHTFRSYQRNVASEYASFSPLNVTSMVSVAFEWRGERPQLASFESIRLGRSAAFPDGCEALLGLVSALKRNY
jgi:hypothetical protein